MSLRAAFGTILALFFVWGFLTCLNDVLVPQLKFIFGLSYAQAAVVPATFFSTCFLFALPCSRLIHLIGYKRTMMFALLIMGAAALAFLPATTVGRYSWFLSALALLGVGITMLQVAAAPYLASLGPSAAAPSRFSLALGFNSLGTTFAPLFGSWLIVRDPTAHGTATLTQAALTTARSIAMHQIRGPYLFLGLSMIATGAAIGFLPLPSPGLNSLPLNSADATTTSIFQHRPLLFGAMTSFLYAGAEIGIGSLLINYLSLQDVGAVTRHNAALLVSIYWGSATVGRCLGWSILRRFNPQRVLALCGGSAAFLVLISTLSHGTLAVFSILAVGLCNAMIVPIVVMLSISGLGERTPQASSIMVASNIGAGLMPPAMGLLADHIGLHHAFLLPVISYGFVLFYAWRGSKGNLLNAEV